MKKIRYIFVLALVSALVLTGCGRDKDKNTASPTKMPVETKSAAPVVTPMITEIPTENATTAPELIPGTSGSTAPNGTSTVMPSAGSSSTASANK